MRLLTRQGVVPNPTPWESPGLKPPDAAHASNLEFSRYINGQDPTAAPVSLTWGNQGTATASITAGRLLMGSVVSTNSHRALMMATPGSGNITVATRFEPNLWATNFLGCELNFLWGTVGTPTAIEAVRLQHEAAPTYGIRLHWTQCNTSWVPTSNRTSVDIRGLTPPYITVDWNGTDLIAKYSGSGTSGSFTTLYTATLGLGRPDYVGLSVNSGNSASVSYATFPFLRFDWTGSDYDPTKAQRGF